MADALREAGAEVRIHDDLFAPAERDEVWLTDFGKLGWIVLTKDTRVRYRTVERTALLRAGVKAFVLVSGNLSGGEMASAFVKGLTAMQKMVLTSHRPSLPRSTETEPLL